MRYTREELIAQLQDIAEQLGGTPTTTDLTIEHLSNHFEKDKPASPGTFSERFGSYADACLEAGLQPNRPGGFYKKTELIRGLQNLSKRKGRTPTVDEVNDSNLTASYKTYINHFGSYRDACEEAGLKPRDYRGRRFIKRRGSSGRIW